VPPFGRIATIYEVNENISKLQCRKRIIICASGNIVDDDNLFDFMTNAKENGVLVSIMMPDDPIAMKKLSEAGINNVTVFPVSFNFVVVDDFAFVYSGPFSDPNNKTTVIGFENCRTAVNDLVNFYEFQWLNATGSLKTIRKVKGQARTSVIQPLKVESSTNTLYFFHNPRGRGDLIRMATEDIIPRSIYNNANIGPRADVWVFCDRIPAPSIDYRFSFSKVFKRVLLMEAYKENGLRIKFLVPKTRSDAYETRWLNATNALNNSEIRLYEDELKGPNFIIVGQRAFVFSHSMSDVVVANEVGLHLATNVSQVVEGLTNFWNQTWSSATLYPKL
jgi:hypothetical protein